MLAVLLATQAAAIWKLSGIEWKDEMRQYLPLNFEGGG
jgi:hypothetical protein